jgi:hypothetical protein
MKRTLGLGLIALSGLVLSGCPIYSNDHYCYDDFDCPSNAYCDSDNSCHVTDSGGTGGSGHSGQGGSGATGGKTGSCDAPSNCPGNSVCGTDGVCHPGDCFFWGCVSGYHCAITQQMTWACEKDGQTDGGAASGGAGGSPDSGPPTDGGTAGQAAGSGGANPDAGDGGSDVFEAAKPVYCGNPSDCGPDQVCPPSGVCADGTCTALGCIQGYVCSTPDGGKAACVPSNPAACILDSDCSASGAKCLNGICTSASDLCTDKTQCPGGDQDNAKCVDGKCVKTCEPDGGKGCDHGYTCDAALGICTVPSDGCKITDDCSDLALVCVAGACVPRCSPGGVCSAGFVCVADGCVPDQKPEFSCSVDGTKDSCSDISICLHHSCYVSCETPNDHACDNNPPDMNVCKAVTTASGQHHVCGSNTNLGSECDPSASSGCLSAKICIDGFCH